MSQEWISVEERLPKDWDDVLVYMPRGKYMLVACTYVEAGNRFWDNDNKTMKFKPTHWMPLPNPPQS